MGETLEQLWISYNLIEKIKGVNVLRKLKVLYMSNNLVKDWVEFNRLAEIPLLEDLLFVGKYTGPMGPIAGEVLLTPRRLLSLCHRV